MSFGIGTAPEQRTVNGFFCQGCNSLLLSLFRHDYKVCDCGNMVDGGNSYVRRGYTDFEAYQKVVEIFDWAPILVAAELGFTDNLGPAGWAAGRPELLQELIDQERLMFATEATAPEDGDASVYHDDAIEQQRLDADAAKQDKLYRDLFLVRPDDPTLP